MIKTHHHVSSHKTVPFSRTFMKFSCGLSLRLCCSDYHKISRLCFESDAWWSDENMPEDHCLSLWRRANARNVSFFTLYGGQFKFSVVNTKLPAILSHRRSTTVSLETYPFIHCFVSLPASHEVKLFARCLKVEVETAIWCVSDSYQYVTSINHCSFTHTITLWLSLVTTQLRFETLLNISEKSKNTSARSKKFPTGTS